MRVRSSRAIGGRVRGRPAQPDAADRLAYWVLRSAVAAACGYGRDAEMKRKSLVRRRHGPSGRRPTSRHRRQCACRPGAFADGGRPGRTIPCVPILIDHLAHARLPGSVAEAAVGADEPCAVAEVYVKLSGYYYFSSEQHPYRDCWDLTLAVYDAFGPARLVWGSDFPHVLLKTGYGRNLRLANTLLDHVDAAERKQILGGKRCATLLARNFGVRECRLAGLPPRLRRKQVARAERIAHGVAAQCSRVARGHVLD